MKRSGEVEVWPKVEIEFPCKQFLKHREQKDIIRQTPDDVIAPHIHHGHQLA
jgi:hypothetical protein